MNSSVEGITAQKTKATFEYQRTLFPIDIAITYPNDQQSADLSIIAAGTDGRHYAVKTTNDGKGFVPATELFCYELARELNIATPEYQIVRLKDSSLAFGSVWEGGAHITKELIQMWAILTGKKPVMNLKGFLSRVYALDLFINNIDRHFGNFIFRDSYKTNIGLAYDFGRAWYEISPYSYEAVKHETNTQIYHNYIVKSGHYDKVLAANALTEISKIDVHRISQILEIIPEEWLPVSIRNELLAWWGESDMSSRINKLKGFL
jgi:hypothetical protein